MKENRLARTLALGLFLLSPSLILAQGPLAPSAAPTPTMKSLDQVEPRTNINTLPMTITQGGSYYLTKSFAQSFSSDAITIQADNVTVDFCGFTIQQTTATGSVVGVRINATTATAIRNVVLKNGTIANFAAVGVTCLGGRNCLIEHLSITQCTGGISFQAFGGAPAVGNTFRQCHLKDNTGSGIVILSGSNVANTIDSCESTNNSTGFSVAAAGNLIIGCRASGNSINYTIAAGNRGGAIILPTASASAFNGSTGALGSGTSDPFANLSF